MDSTEVPGAQAPPPLPPPSNFRTLLRQNSEKFGRVVEAVTLPMNQRSSMKGSAPTHEVIPLDIESQDVQGVNVTGKEPPPKEVPVFMVSISFFQVVMFYFGGEYIWLYLCYDPFRRHELWRYLTIMLVHSSTSHLWGNIVFQLILGVLLEVVHHWRRVSAIYVAGVLGGSLAITLLDPDNYGVGASAGVYALLTAHLATIIMNWNEMDNKCCRLFWLLLYIGFDVGLNAYMELVQNVDTHTSHAGHFGGALVGFIVAVFVLRNFQKHAWEKRFQKVLGVILLVIFAVVVVVNVCFPSYYLRTAWNVDYMDTYVGYVIKSIHESKPDSKVREVCMMNEECKMLLQDHADMVNKAIEPDFNNT